MALRLEPALRCVEDDRVLEVLAARLVEGLGAALRGGLTVLARPRHIKLEALSIVRLIELETGRGCVEADLLANALLKVRGSGLVLPLALSLG